MHIHTHRFIVTAQNVFPSQIINKKDIDPTDCYIFKTAACNQVPI